MDAVTPLADADRPLLNSSRHIGDGGAIAGPYAPLAGDAARGAKAGDDDRSSTTSAGSSLEGDLLEVMGVAVCTRRLFCLRWPLVIIGVAMAAMAGAALIAFDPAARRIISYVTTIANAHSPAFGAWVDPESAGVYTHREYTFYNVTNPDAVFAGARPHLEPTGPYVYRERTVKDRRTVVWFANGSVGYHYSSEVTFVPSMSKDAVTGRQLSEADAMVVVNPALKGILYRIGRLPWDVVPALGLHRTWACDAVNDTLGLGAVGPKAMFNRRPVGELLWGYKEPLWSELHVIVKLVDYDASTRFMSQWRGPVVAPSPYTYRSGQRCPLWTDMAECNSTASLLTIEDSGAAQRLVPERQRHAVRGSWLPMPGYENGRQSPADEWEANGLGSADHGDISTFAGQRSVWWWGPEIDGLTGGDSPAVRGAESPSAALLRQLRQIDAASAATVAPALRPRLAELKAMGASFNATRPGGRRYLAALDAAAAETSPTKGAAGPAPIAGDRCRRVHGSNGMRFRPGVTEATRLGIFTDMVGLPMPLAFRTRSAAGGLQTLRFSLEPAAWRSTNESRQCHGQRFGGFVNMSGWAFGPGVVSKPFFMDSCLFDADATRHADGAVSCRAGDAESDAAAPPTADDDAGFTADTLLFNCTFANPEAGGAPLPLRDYVAARYGAAGSARMREELDSFVDVEPHTGVTAAGLSGGVISMFLGPPTIRGCLDGERFGWARRLPRTVVPFIRFQRRAVLTGVWLHRLRLGTAALRHGPAVLAAVLACGALLLVAGAVLVVWRRRELARGAHDYVAIDEADAPAAASRSAE